MELVTNVARIAPAIPMIVFIVLIVLIVLIADVLSTFYSIRCVGCHMMMTMMMMMMEQITEESLKMVRDQVLVVTEKGESETDGGIVISAKVRQACRGGINSWQQLTM